MRDILIAGGGLAGLISAICLSEADLDVVLVEKKEYPFHKVCGEYISNEVVPFLESIGCYPHHLEPALINNFRLSDMEGREASLPLDLGGFGLSRYRLDHFLYEKAKERGTEFRLHSKVLDIQQKKEGFRVKLNKGEELEARLVIGAWGKRSTADRGLDRSFFRQRTDYIGVKYHIKAPFLPDNEVSLHNFPGGYCGISKIEDGAWNMCYLGSKVRLKQWGSLEAMEEHDLAQNPLLRRVIEEAEYLYNKPEVINEINFSRKELVEQGVLMAGDAAGLITPLCGNGMAMAIHAGKLLSETILNHWPLKEEGRPALEEAYKNAWQNLFARRLWIGRQTQKMFGSRFTSALAVGCLKAFKPLGNTILRQTHGKVF